MIKNLTIALALCLVVLFILPAAAQDVQLLQNNGVETWTNGPSNPPDHWVNINADSIFVSQEGTIVHGGLYSANLTWITPTQAQCDFLSDPVAIISGQSYACSTWALDNDGGGRITVSFRFDVGGNYYPSFLYTVDSPDWQQIGFTYTAPVGATSVRVGIRCYDFGSWDDSSTVYVDDVTLWGQAPQGNQPPSITNVLRYPFPNVFPADNTIVEASIVDTDGSVVSDSMYSRVLPGTFTPVTHDSISTGNRHWFTIGQHNEGDSIEYYIVATDDDGARSQSPTRGYTVYGGGTPGIATIYSLQHTTNEGVLPDCFPSDSSDNAVMITGLVVGRYERSETYQRRFFVQDAATPWSGVYVFNTPDPVQVGDSVTIGGVLIEYFAETELGTISSAIVHSSGHALPPPIVLTCAQYNSMDSCTVNAEPYEGMIIRINNLTLTSSAGFGDFWANDGSSDSVIVMDDLSTGGADSCIYVIGETYSYVRGIGRYTFGQYKIAPRFSSDLYIAPSECTGENIFNVQNSLNPGLDTADCWPSPDTGQLVTVCGIVTAVTQGTQPRFYLQDQGNTAWGGIYCFDFRLDNGDTIFTSLGDYVQITSHVHEYYGWTELDSVTEFILLGSGQPLPDTAVITVATLGVMCDYTAEPYEDILVRLNNVTVVSDNGFDELWIRDNSGSDSIRIDSDLWTFGADQPSPIPSVGSTYEWIVGVVRWEGRQSSSRDRGWLVLPRFASDFEQLVVPEPNMLEVWSVNSTTLAATFDRVMDPVTTENPANYSTVHGLGISAADLDPSGRRVNLTTSAQPNNTVDSLVVNNVCDIDGICMTAPQQVLYHSGITPIAVVQAPDTSGDISAIVGHVVTVKGVLVSDSTMSHPTNIFINDTSGPPYNGVLTYTGGLIGADPYIGDTVMFTASIDEYFGATELADLGVYNNFSIVGSGPDPDPYLTSVASLNANREGFEGVFVALCDSFVITSDSVDPYGFMIHSLSSPNDSIIVHRQPPQHTRYNYVPVEGVTIRGLAGVYRFQRDQFRIMPRFDADFNSFDTWCGGGPGCDYVAGDINNNGEANGVDVSYGVNYFKGFGPPPPVICFDCPAVGENLFGAGDVNGNCGFNGVDITYFVNYLKGIGPALTFCPACPPTGMIAPSPGTPTLVPRLKTNSVTGGNVE